MPTAAPSCPSWGRRRYVLVGCNVIHFHGVGQARVGHSRCHVDLVVVHGGPEQRASSFHGSQLLPLKLGGVVDAHLVQALPAKSMREKSNFIDLLGGIFALP